MLTFTKFISQNIYVVKRMSFRINKLLLKQLTTLSYWLKLVLCNRERTSNTTKSDILWTLSSVSKPIYTSLCKSHVFGCSKFWFNNITGSFNFMLKSCVWLFETIEIRLFDRRNLRLGFTLKECLILNLTKIRWLLFKHAWSICETDRSKNFILRYVSFDLKVWRILAISWLSFIRKLRYLQILTV